ncbi:MAG: DUF6531 domain-containing protein, partial [Rhabdochlamydiaceae bacterium]
MRQYLFILFVLVFTSTTNLQAENSAIKAAHDRICLSAESEPTSFVNNVNTIHGNLLLSSVDIVQPGPHPLHFVRYYDNMRALNLWLGKGTTTNYPLWVQGVPDTEGMYMFVEEDCGSCVTYTTKASNIEKDEKTCDYYLDPGTIYEGFTNTGRGEISGRTNSKNNVYTCTDKTSKKHGPWGNFTARLADGTERTFHSSDDVEVPMNLRKEQKPSGNKLFYEYHNGKKDIGYLKRITACSENEKRDFGSLEFEYNFKDKITVTSHNGKKVTYSYSTLGSDPSTHFKLPY